VEELAKVLADKWAAVYARMIRIEPIAAGVQCWRECAAAAIAHCGKREEEQRQRAEKAERQFHSVAHALEACERYDDATKPCQAKSLHEVCTKAWKLSEERGVQEQVIDALAAEIARLKADAMGWADSGPNGRNLEKQPSQPAPEGLSALLSAINDHLRHGSCSADGYLSEAMRDAELRVAQPQAQEGKKE
jgi:hypothetical protein